jgi:ribosomal protein S18 acetylase RimI-like enzyme
VCDSRTPPQFEARLLLEGYEREESLVMVLEGAIQATVKDYEIGAVDNDDEWDSYLELKRADWVEHMRRIGRDEQLSVGEELAATNRLKSPPMRYWLAYDDDGAASGFFSSWEGVDGVAQVEDLSVLEERRHRGIATALLAHCVADCRTLGAGPVVIVSDPTDTPKRMYAAMGWQPVGVKRNYIRHL